MSSVTDSGIIKAFTLCDDSNSCSKDCPLTHLNTTGVLVCRKVLKKSMLDLYSSQKSEIERLRNLIVGSREIIGHLLYVIRDNKTEAMKEFADKLQDRCLEQDGCIYASDIGAVLYELTGDKDVNENT